MGKNTIRILLLLLLIGAMLHVSAWAETAVVTGSDVNMREGPGTNFRIVNCLPEGAKVTVTDRSNGSWFRVDYGGTTGFMAAAFLEIEEEESARPAENAANGGFGEGREGYVNAMYVRFRSAPGSDFSVRGEYNRGKPLRYYFTTGDWAACIIDGVPGYIYKDYVAFGTFDAWADPVDTQQDTDEMAGLPVYPVPTATYAPESHAEAGPDELALQHATIPGVEQTPGYINANYVRFRKGPASSYPIIETYNAGKAVGVTGLYMDWTACLIDGAFGFVYSDFITIPGQQTQEETVTEETSWTETVYIPQTTQTQVPMPAVQTAVTDGHVAGNNVRMRSAPSMSASVVDELSYGNALKIVGVTGDWTAVICNGKAGYIYSQFVGQGSFNVDGGSGGGTQQTTGALSGSSLEKGQQIAWYAYQYLGCPYSWGGRDPSGFDCSGFVYYVYQHFGITLNRVAQDQARNGYAVSASELQPGDVLCFYSGSSYIGHVGIYIGYGKFIHAQNSATGVVVTDLAGHYAERGFEARRMV